jgi:hypothetical protein
VLLSSSLHLETKSIMDITNELSKKNGSSGTFNVTNLVDIELWPERSKFFVDVGGVLVTSQLEVSLSNLY